jgi:hypothetical protein
MIAAGLPTAEGFFWAKWVRCRPDHPDAEVWTPSDKWETVELFENCIEPTDDEYMMVFVGGCTQPQRPEDFEWGEPLIRPQP